MADACSRPRVVREGSLRDQSLATLLFGVCSESEDGRFKDSEVEHVERTSSGVCTIRYVLLLSPG